MKKETNHNIEEKNNYPGVSDRVKASVVDSIVIVIFLFIASFIFAKFEAAPNYSRVMTFVFIFGLYDPIFTRFLGGTIGHFAMGIRVKRASNIQKNIIFPLAILRFIVKLVLGLVSLFTVGSNMKHLAIHDYVAGSVVLFKE